MKMKLALRLEQQEPEASDNKMHLTFLALWKNIDENNGPGILGQLNQPNITSVVEALAGSGELIFRVQALIGDAEFQRFTNKLSDNDSDKIADEVNDFLKRAISPKARLAHLMQNLEAKDGFRGLALKIAANPTLASKSPTAEPSQS